MIAADQEARVLRLYHGEKWRVHTIARQLGLHHMTVRRVLVRAGIAVTNQRHWSSKLDPYLPFIQATLAEYSLLTAARLYEMVRQRGYAGGPDHFRHLVGQHRPRRPAEAYLRLHTLPGEQGQVDWAHFGKLPIGDTCRPLLGFVMVLSWSRWIFLHFSLNARMENFLRGHQAAVLARQGCPRVLLYDNLKSAVLERRGDAARLHPTLLALAAHYSFEPRPVAVGARQRKGTGRAGHPVRAPGALRRPRGHRSRSAQCRGGTPSTAATSWTPGWAAASPSAPTSTATRSCGSWTWPAKVFRLIEGGSCGPRLEPQHSADREWHTGV